MYFNVRKSTYLLECIKFSEYKIVNIFMKRLRRQWEAIGFWKSLDQKAQEASFNNLCAQFSLISSRSGGTDELRDALINVLRHITNENKSIGADGCFENRLQIHYYELYYLCHPIISSR